MIRFNLNANFYIRKRDSLLKRLRRAGPFISGSLVEAKRKCGKDNCGCKKGEGHVSYYLTDKVKGKTRIVYVTKEKVEEIKKWVDEYQDIKNLLKEISDLQRIIINKNAQQKRSLKKRKN